MTDVMNTTRKISIVDAFAQVQFLPDRTPDMPDDISENAFAKVCDYRDGGVFIGHYAGASPWERHSQGDELVWIISGQTTLIAYIDGEERRETLSAGEMLCVPANTWHRFETAVEVKVMTVTPQPTDHSIDLPADE
ncbi:MAG: hypothetical protein DHS20C01_03760 [marine bacterium B5-7]|nr:MAG: hypothetical protein DHS20C01_03760 [marine bacterium B5-7]